MARTATRLAAVGAVTVTVGVYLSGPVVYSPWHRFFDLRVYRGAVRWWLQGRPLYDFVLPHTAKGFTYPPFAVLVLLPAAVGSETTAEALLTVVSAVLVGLTTWVLLTPVAARHGWSRWFVVALAVPLVVAMEPIRETLGWGQVGVILLALALADVTALRSGRPWAGVGLGLAAAIKVTPGLFVVYLLLSGRRRAAGVAAGTFLAASLLAFALGPRDSVRFWTRALWETGRVGAADRTSDQSVLGLLARLADPGRPDRLVWALLAGLVLVVGLGRAVRAARSGDELAGVTLTGLVTCLVSPIAWTHHFFWVVPAVVVLVDVAGGTPVRAAPSWLRGHVDRAAAAGAVLVAAVFGSSLIWFFAGATAQRAGVAQMLGENAYLLVSVALLVLLPIRDVRASARRPAPPRPAGSSPR
jgi:alpha-1,2-mannosyltransferase